MKQLFILLITTLLLLPSCKQNTTSWWKEDNTQEQKIFRFDQLVDEYVSLNSYTSLQQMNTDYPTPTRLLIEKVLSLGSVQDTNIEHTLREFYLDSTMQVITQDVRNQYSDLTAEGKEIFAVFNKMKKEDKYFKIPFVYTQISGLNQSIVVGDSLLGISLDKYLGSNYPLYLQYYPENQRRVMNRRNIVPDALYFYFSHEYPMAYKHQHTLLEMILDNGKIHWAIAKLRGISIQEEAGFDNRRTEWYEKNEADLWKWMNERDMLSSTDNNYVKFFLSPRDNKIGGNERPDMFGLWLGLQIVDHYMNSHPEIDLNALLHITDYNELLKQSGYNPGN